MSRTLNYTCRTLTAQQMSGRVVIRSRAGVGGPAFDGTVGDLSLRCGSCGRVIAANITARYLMNVAIVCQCGSYNSTALI